MPSILLRGRFPVPVFQFTLFPSNPRNFDFRIVGTLTIFLFQHSSLHWKVSEEGFLLAPRIDTAGSSWPHILSRLFQVTVWSLSVFTPSGTKAKSAEGNNSGECCQCKKYFLALSLTSMLRTATTLILLIYLHLVKMNKQQQPTTKNCNPRISSIVNKNEVIN